MSVEVGVDMSRELDEKIRDLFSEANRAAPEAPRSTDLWRERSQPVRWARWVLIPAASMIALLVGVAVLFDGLGVDLGLGLAGSADEGVGSSGDDGDLAMILADLNLSCSDLDEEIGSSVPPLRGDAEAFERLLVIRAGLDDLENRFEAVTTGIAPDADLERVREDFEVLGEELEMAIDEGPQRALDRHNMVMQSLGQLGDALGGIGALECADLP